MKKTCSNMNSVTCSFLLFLPSLRQHLHFIWSHIELYNHCRVYNYPSSGSQGPPASSLSWPRPTASKMLWVGPNSLPCNKLPRGIWCASSLRPIALHCVICKDRDCICWLLESLEYTGYNIKKNGRDECINPFKISTLKYFVQKRKKIYQLLLCPETTLPRKDCTLAWLELIPF